MQGKDFYALLALVPIAPMAANARQQSSDTQPKRPNIIHIMSDDHSYQAISAYGDALSRQAPTPNIDRLAQEGMLFRRAYVENSLSTPSRACLMTGLYSHQSGQRTLLEVMDSTVTFVPQLLQAGGYTTGFVGKWHMRCDPKGFDWYMSFRGQGEYYNPGFKTPQSAGQYLPEEGYVSELVTKHAIEFLEQRDTTKPFCLYVHHKAPHRNWLPDLKYLELYDDVEFPIPGTFYDDYSTRGYAAHNQAMSIAESMTMIYDLKLKEWALTHPDDEEGVEDLEWMLGRMTPEQRAVFEEAYLRRNAPFAAVMDSVSADELLRWKYQRYVRDYLSVIRSVDDSVGEILAYLKEHGLEENTIVTYCSDQGFYMGEHGWFDKRFMYEESFRTPLIMRYPALIKPGVESETLVQNIDFAPTYLDLAGVDIPDEMVGRSIVPVLRKAGKKPLFWRRYLYYHYYDAPSEHMVPRHDGVFDKRYKLINFYYDDRGEMEPYYEFYDLRTDPQELDNRYGDKKYARVIKRLQRRLERFRKAEGIDEC